MGFSLDAWKKKAKEKLKGWLGRIDKAGANMAYFTIASLTLWPVVEAARAEDWSSVAVLGGATAKAVSQNLLANIIQNWKDEADGTA